VASERSVEESATVKGKPRDWLIVTVPTDALEPPDSAMTEGARESERVTFCAVACWMRMLSMAMASRPPDVLSER